MSTIVKHSICCSYAVPAVHRWQWPGKVQSGAQDTQEGRSRTVADNQMNEQKDSLFGDPVLMATEGETFDTVMAAIQSNSAAKSYVAVVLARA